MRPSVTHANNTRQHARRFSLSARSGGLPRPPVPQEETGRPVTFFDHACLHRLHGASRRHPFTSPLSRPLSALLLLLALCQSTHTRPRNSGIGGRLGRSKTQGEPTYDTLHSDGGGGGASTLSAPKSTPLHGNGGGDSSVKNSRPRNKKNTKKKTTQSPPQNIYI